MRRVLVAGAGGGIGRALVDALAARPDVERTWALHRRPVSSTNEKVVWLEADLRDNTMLSNAVDRMGAEGGLDGLIVATGLLHEPGIAPERSLGEIDPRPLMVLYEANAVGPLMLLAACRTLFRSAETPFACLLSAQVGSIGDNRLGGWYGYRMAKAALNMAVRCAAIELGRTSKPVTVVAVHPGTTRTGLSYRFVKRRAQPVATPEVAARRLISLLSALPPEASGTLMNYDGAPLSW